MKLFLVVFDEQLSGYHPSKIVKDKARAAGDPIPVQYIPRKPDPNGLLLYLLATYVKSNGQHQKLPYVLDFFPHLTVGDAGLSELVAASVDRLDFPLNDLHYIGDSAFYSAAIMEKLIQSDCLATIACPSSRAPEVFDLLTHNLPNNYSRSARRESVVYSTFASVKDSNEVSFMRVASTAFDCSDVEIPNVASSGIANSTNMPIYSAADLQGNKIPELKEICKKHHVPYGARKQNFIDNIITRSKLMNSDIDKAEGVLLALSKANFENMHIPNKLYRQHFNLVDLVDRYCAQFKNGHGVNNWRTKYILNILRTAIVNCWVRTQTLFYSSWATYRESLAEKLLE